MAIINTKLKKFNTLTKQSSQPKLKPANNCID